VQATKQMVLDGERGTVFACVQPETVPALGGVKEKKGVRKNRGGVPFNTGVRRSGHLIPGRRGYRAAETIRKGTPSPRKGEIA